MTTPVIKCNSENPEKEMINRAVNLLKAGGLVAFPTETVYGLGANLLNEKAISRLYEIKMRPRNKPFSIAISHKEKIEEWASDISVFAYKLIDRFWPGPLTLILKSKEDKNVGLRMPNNKIALEIIERAGVPLALPSANLSGHSSPKTAQEVLADLDGLIDLTLDAGETELGIESTVLDLVRQPYRILREGAIKEDRIKELFKIKTILFVCTGNSCRSVMAKGLLEKRIKGRQDLEIFTAGIGAFSGMKASPETIELLAQEGVDVSGHKAQALTALMVKKSDLILVMEKRHEERVLELVPQARERLYLLKEFAHRKLEEDLDIRDPIGKPMEDFKSCFSIIKEAIDKVADLI